MKVAIKSDTLSELPQFEASYRVIDENGQHTTTNTNSTTTAADAVAATTSNDDRSFATRL